MAPRLILVSNRVSVPDSSGRRHAGGLTVAVNAALKHREGVWFGWSGEVRDQAPPAPPTLIRRRMRSYMTLDLSENDFQEYYNGFANRVLWPILHYRVDLAEFNSGDLDGYLRVNRRFADALSPIIQPEDTLWVHDYHLLPLAKLLRARGHENPIGFFLHIPCPPPDMLDTLPQHAETMGALMYYDLVGLQTNQDAENLGRYFAAHGAEPKRAPGLFEVDGRRLMVRAFPVSIETTLYARAARRAVSSKLVEELRASLIGRRLIVGVDRLDYSKGIPHRINAFGHFLDKHPEWLGKVSFLQVTPKSRGEVPEYAAMNREINELVGQINGRHGDASWTPIRYVNRSYSRAALAGLYRTGHVALVTPLRDGMNLVAKEYVAAQDSDDPGVLILSQFAGAAQELEGGALIVNPHQTEAMAEAIKTALEMPLEERVVRQRRMMEHLEANDIDRWAERFLAALEEVKERPGLLNSLRSLFAQRV